MATLPIVLLNGSTADANEVMSDFTEIYTNIDQTNVASANKSGTGRFLLQTSPSITTPTISGDVNFDSGTLFVDATNNRVGVSNSSPVANLDLIGSFLTLGTFDAGLATSIRSQRTDGSAKTWIKADQGGDISLFVGEGAPGDFSGVTSGFRVIRGGDCAVASTKRIYLDNGGDTYINESAANDIYFTAGGTNSVRLSATRLRLQAGVDLSIKSGRVIYLDDGGDTFIAEFTPNTITLSTAGVSVDINTAAIILNNRNIQMDSGQYVYLNGANTVALRTTGSNELTFITGGSPTAILNSSGELLLPDVDPPTANYANRNSFVKAWGVGANTGGLTGTTYNLASHTQLGTGYYRFTFSTDFASSTSYVANIMPIVAGAARIVSIDARASTHIDYRTYDSAGADADTTCAIIVIGDQ